MVLPGGKLYFYQTGTSTPQNTYQDVDLTTAHENPVVADSEGVFAPIYFDSSLPDYRVKLTDSSGTQIYQVDDVPSGQDTSRTYRLASDAPELIFEETDSSANNGKWAIRVNAETLTIDLLNDAESVRTTIASFTRTGTSTATANFTTDYLQVNSEIVYGAPSQDFTGTLTGMTGTVSSAIFKARRHAGSLVHIKYGLNADLTGTSNSTAMTLTGVPSGYRPKASFAGSSSTAFGWCTAIDNGSVTIAFATLDSNGTITFNKGTTFTTFTNSGTKGIPGGWSCVFVIT